MDLNRQRLRCMAFTGQGASCIVRWWYLCLEGVESAHIRELKESQNGKRRLGHASLRSTSTHHRLVITLQKLTKEFAQCSPVGLAHVVHSNVGQEI